VTSTYTVYSLFEAISPITHMARSEGNESLVAREPLTTPDGVLWIPYVSGNAIRHRCFRRPGMRHLVEQCGLRGKLSLAQLNFLFHGGNLTEGGGREDTRAIADWQRLCPLGRLLGGCLPSQILSGALLPDRGYLVCEENRGALVARLPAGWELDAKPLRRAETFVSGYQYVRNDAVKSVPELLPPPANGVVLPGMGDEEPREKTNQMIFAGQAVTRGALFFRKDYLAHVSRLELGAYLLSLSLWQAEGGTVGGQSARGHGRLAASVHVEGCDDPEACVTEYLAHVEVSGPELADWLDRMFRRKEDKPKRGKRKEAVGE
jgi:hypothetical protein